MALDAVLAEARAAKAAGASRFCMGAAWRSPKDRDLDAGLRHGRGRQGARARDLRHARHAHRRRRRSGSKTAGLDYYNHNLDTSPEFYGDDHHHAHLSGSPRHARPCARRRHPCLLRRHRRHGRDARGPRRHDRDAREPAGASRKRADQHAGAGRRHAARRRQARSIRSISCAPSRSRASPCRARWCGSRPAART